MSQSPLAPPPPGSDHIPHSMPPDPGIHITQMSASTSSLLPGSAMVLPLLLMITLLRPLSGRCTTRQLEGSTQ
eukprot:scaffold46190_cov29-Tisochrysis_lutea.AAC.2